MKKIIFTVILVLFTQAVLASDYTLELRSPNDRTKAVFRIRKSDGVVHNTDAFELPLLSSFVASTTAGALLTTTGTAFNPYLILNSASGSSRVRFRDAVQAPVAFTFLAPENWATGGDMTLTVTASAATNVASRTFVSASVSVNYGAYSARTTTAASFTSSAVNQGFNEYDIDFAGQAALEAVVPGDVISLKIYRQEIGTSAATATLEIQNVVVKYNDDFAVSW